MLHLSQLIHPLPIALGGKLFPSEKSLVLVVGDGYIAGGFIASIFMPEVNVLGSELVPSLNDSQKAKEDVICRYAAIVLALCLGLFWVIGHLVDAHQFPVLPDDHDLFGAIPALGIGAMIASSYAFLWGLGHRSWGILRWAGEREAGDKKAKLLSLGCAAAYAAIWLNVGPGH